MKRNTPGCVLFLSILAVLIGCQAFGNGSSGAGGATDAQNRVVLPPLGPTAAENAEADAPAIRAASQQPTATAHQSEPTVDNASATAQEPEPPLPPPVLRPTTSIPSEGCVTTACHPGIKAMPVTHGPVDTDVCDACHEEVDPSRHTFKMLNTGSELCGSCHELELEEEHVHQPVADDLCTECHDPHGGQDRFMMRAAGAATCLECHDDVTEGMPMVHGPVAAGACSACHRSHSSNNPKLLTLPHRDLCLECHVTLKNRLDAVRTVHGPVAVECIACHSPHATERKMMLKAPTAELCVDCHSEIEDLLDEATTEHDPVTTEPACRNCHDPHGSDFPAMLLNDMVPLCLSCHDREIELADGGKLANMKATLEAGPNHHGPIAQSNCAGGCHQVHGGTNFRLLVEEYPAEFYAPFGEGTYELCFSCHDRQLVLEERTDRLTNFRNGDHNQHYVHVNKATKGRTCRACHETHASNNPKHIRVAVPFGSAGWQLPINFEKTETGGLCSPGCHRPYGYDRDDPVRNLAE